MTTQVQSPVAHARPVRGVVVRVSKDGKTASVQYDRVVRHKLYGKSLHRSTVVFADVGSKQLELGTKVDIVPCRRISKTKSWRVKDVF